MPLRGPGGGGGEWVPLFIAKDPSEPLLMSVNLIEPTPRRGSRFDTEELLRCGYYSSGVSDSSAGGSDLSSPRLSMSGSSRADSPVHRRPSQMDLDHLAPTMIPIRTSPSPPPLEQNQGRSSSRSPRHSPTLQAVAGFVSVAMHRTASATSSALAKGCAAQSGHIRRRSSLSLQQDALHSYVDFAPSAGDAESERRRRAKMVLGAGEQAAALEGEDERYAAMLKLLGALVFCGLLIPVAGQWLL